VTGIGQGLFQSPNTRALVNAAPGGAAGEASGLLTTARTVGQSFGIAADAVGRHRRRGVLAVLVRGDERHGFRQACGDGLASLKARSRIHSWISLVLALALGGCVVAGDRREDPRENDGGSP
jgi:hypothetical protein